MMEQDDNGMTLMLEHADESQLSTINSLTVTTDGTVPDDNAAVDTPEEDGSQAEAKVVVNEKKPVKLAASRRHTCISCTKTFSTKRDLVTHQYIHRENPIFLCTTCNKSFTSEASYRRHVQSHKTPVPTTHRQYMCSQCGMVFESMKLLSSHHSDKHVDEKRFVCGICGSQFAWPENLRAHHRTHEINPHECTLCCRRFVDATSLRVHMRNSHGPDSASNTHHKAFSCTLCGRAFQFDFSLRAHMQGHEQSPMTAHHFQPSGANSLLSPTVSAARVPVSGQSTMSHYITMDRDGVIDINAAVPANQTGEIIVEVYNYQSNIKPSSNSIISQTTKCETQGVTADDSRKGNMHKYHCAEIVSEAVAESVDDKHLENRVAVNEVVREVSNAEGNDESQAVEDVSANSDFVWYAPPQEPPTDGNGELASNIEQLVSSVPATQLSITTKPIGDNDIDQLNCTTSVSDSAPQEISSYEIEGSTTGAIHIQSCGMEHVYKNDSDRDESINMQEISITDNVQGMISIVHKGEMNDLSTTPYARNNRHQIVDAHVSQSDPWYGDVTLPCNIQQPSETDMCEPVETGTKLQHTGSCSIELTCSPGRPDTELQQSDASQHNIAWTGEERQQRTLKLTSMTTELDMHVSEMDQENEEQHNTDNDEENNDDDSDANEAVMDASQMLQQQAEDTKTASITSVKFDNSEPTSHRASKQKKRISEPFLFNCVMTDEKPFTCAECGESFRWEVSLSIHHKLHTDGMFRNQKCNGVRRVKKHLTHSALNRQNAKLVRHNAMSKKTHMSSWQANRLAAAAGSSRIVPRCASSDDEEVNDKDMYCFLIQPEEELVGERPASGAAKSYRQLMGSKRQQENTQVMHVLKKNQHTVSNIGSSAATMMAEHETGAEMTYDPCTQLIYVTVETVGGGVDGMQGQYIAGNSAITIGQDVIDLNDLVAGDQTYCAPTNNPSPAAATAGRSIMQVHSFKHGDEVQVQWSRHVEAYRRAAFVCRQCHAVLTTPSAVSRHRRRHALADGCHHTLVCSACLSCFISRADLLLHRRVYHTESCHVCVTCQRVFSTGDKLLQHRKRTHRLTVTAFVCQYCSKRYLTETQCLAHQQTHGTHG